MHRQDKNLDTMTTEDLLARRATLCAPARQGHAILDKERHIAISFLMLFVGMLGGVATADGTVYEGWPEISRTRSARV